MIQQLPTPSNTLVASRKSSSVLATYTTREQLLSDIETEQRAFVASVASSNISETVLQMELLEAYLEYWQSLELIQELINKFHSTDHQHDPTPVLDELRKDPANQHITNDELRESSADHQKMVAEMQDALGKFSLAISKYTKAKVVN